MAWLIFYVLFAVLMLISSAAACYRARTGIWPVTLMAMFLGGCAG